MSDNSLNSSLFCYRIQSLITTKQWSDFICFFADFLKRYYSVPIVSTDENEDYFHCLPVKIQIYSFCINDPHQLIVSFTGMDKEGDIFSVSLISRPYVFHKFDTKKLPYSLFVAAVFILLNKFCPRCFRFYTDAPEFLLYAGSLLRTYYPEETFVFPKIVSQTEFSDFKKIINDFFLNADDVAGYIF